jgi:hypothetical protein
MFRLPAIVSTSDVLRFSMPKFHLEVDRTIDSQLLRCTVSYLTHSEMEHEAFLAVSLRECEATRIRSWKNIFKQFPLLYRLNP